MLWICCVTGTNFDRKAAKRNSAVGNELTMTMVGTKLYCAPEIIMMQRYNESVASDYTCASLTWLRIDTL